MTNAQDPTETSPLLPKADPAPPVSRPQLKRLLSIDPSSGLAPEGADPHVQRGYANSDREDGGDIERQATDGEASKYVGMPEMKKRLKYILPAVAIGVSHEVSTIDEDRN